MLGPHQETDQNRPWTRNAYIFTSRSTFVGFLIYESKAAMGVLRLLKLAQERGEDKANYLVMGWCLSIDCLVSSLFFSRDMLLTFYGGLKLSLAPFGLSPHCGCCQARRTWFSALTAWI